MTAITIVITVIIIVMTVIKMRIIASTGVVRIGITIVIVIVVVIVLVLVINSNRTKNMRKGPKQPGSAPDALLCLLKPRSRAMAHTARPGGGSGLEGEYSCCMLFG